MQKSIALRKEAYFHYNTLERKDKPRVSVWVSYLLFC